MNNLELKNIAAYLPFGLIVRLGRKVFKVNCWNYESVSEHWSSMQCAIRMVKPELRPLSDLVKENPETGKPFFIEVLKASCEMPFEGKNNKFWKPLFTGDTQREYKPDKSTYLEIDNAFNDYSFSIDLSNGDLTTYCNGELAITDNQAQYFRELARLHFDTDNLIGKGLAIAKAS